MLFIQVYSCLWYLIWSNHVWESLYLIIWLFRFPQWTSGKLFFQTDFRTWFFGALFLESCYENHPDSVTLQKHHSLSNYNFKHSSAHMSSLNLIPKLSFEIRFCMFIIHVYYTESNVCSPWTPWFCSWLLCLFFMLHN